MQKYLISTARNIILNFLDFHFGKILHCFRTFNDTEAVPRKHPHKQLTILKINEVKTWEYEANVIFFGLSESYLLVLQPIGDPLCYKKIRTKCELTKSGCYLLRPTEYHNHPLHVVCSITSLNPA